MLGSAFEFARTHHRDQSKKGTSLPFLYHPMAVASLVFKYGGDEAQACAALLHDTIGLRDVSRSEIEKRFGSDVASLTYSFLDPEMSPEAAANWRATKEAYLAKVAELEPRAMMIVMCEELHEIEELLHDLRYYGQTVWERYPVHGMEMCWYFRELVRIANKALLEERFVPLISELSGNVRALKAIVFDAKPY